MKKRLLAVIMATMMTMSLAGCGEAKPAEANVSGDEVATTEYQEENESANEADAVDETVATDAGDSDLQYVKDQGKLIVGITDFEPMDYKDENGNWIGFDADMATAFAESIGVDVEFIEIDWDNKVLELDAKSIDCVWNGMTLTDEVKSSMTCSNPYCNNAQIVIVPAEKADQYTTVEDLTELTFAVEAGSAGEEMANENGFEYTPVKAQADAVMEVAAGTSDAAIIDSLMAAAMVGEGTSYENLAYTVQLNAEEYGVGFRKDSDLADALNKFFADSYADGSMMECAEKYGVQASLIAQ